MKHTLHHIIHPHQAVFIPNRSIPGNCIINHEIMFYLKSKKGSKGFMAIKVDMAKAYDMVEWSPLLRILQMHGFCDQFCALILECVSSAYYSILVNGSPFGFFSSSRGLCQGNPMSPALFTVLSDLLSRIISCSEASGKLSCVKVSRSSPWITHLMYVDDLVIYCKANMVEAQEVKSCVNTY